MSDDGAPSTYNNSHRAFLQVFLARSVLTFDEAKPILAAIMTAQEGRETLENDITEADFNNYVLTCNNAISPFDLEIRSTLSQHDKKRIYALVNTTSDPATQLATTHTADEISYLKRLLDSMFEIHNTGREEVMAITSMQALRLSRAPAREAQEGEQTQGASGQGLTQPQAEHMLNSLVAEGWFERSKAGFYSLSPRALMELRGWLIETYNEGRDDEEDEDEEPVDRIKMCQACKEIVTVGQRCANQECHCRLHNFCTRNIFRVLNAEVCPLCKTAWDGQHFVGENAAKGQRRRSTGGASRRGTMQTDGADNSDSD